MARGCEVPASGGLAASGDGGATSMSRRHGDSRSARHGGHAPVSSTRRRRAATVHAHSAAAIVLCGVNSLPPPVVWHHGTVLWYYLYGCMMRPIIVMKTVSYHDGPIGIGIATTTVGLLVGGIAAAVSRKK